MFMLTLTRNFAFQVFPLRWAAAAFLSVSFAVVAYAQDGSADLARSAGTAPASAVVPQQVRYAGKLSARAGETVETEFRIYAAAEGGEPLWTETQQVPVGLDGSYAVLLGGASAAGLPQRVFAGGAARWLGLSVGGGQETERVLLSSVPYAMKSADAESLAGHTAAEFVTQAQLAAVEAQTLKTAAEVEAAKTGQAGAGQSGAQPEFQPLTNGALTGSGTSGTIPVWNGQYTEGNSNLVEVGSDIGINVTTPASTLDVGGGATVRGTLALPATATATTTAGHSSQALEGSASAWSTTAAAAVAENFALEAVPVGNNTASPSGALALLSSAGTNPLTATGFSIASNGRLTFATGQTFPGVIASVTGASPIIASTTSGAVTVGLNTAALETALNVVYPQLTASNFFHGNQTVGGMLTVTSTINGAYETLSGALTAEAGIVSNNLVNMRTSGVATTAAPYQSPQFVFTGSAYNSSLAAAQGQNFVLQEFITGNNTATPGGYLAVEFGQGAASPHATGLQIGSNGVITFAPTQTFPVTGTGGGTITSVATTSPLTGSATTGPVTIGLNQSALVTNVTPSLETTFDARYALLSGGNVFSSFVESYQTSGAGGAAVLGWGKNGSEGIFGQSDTSDAIQGTTLTPANGSSGVWGNVGGSNASSDTFQSLGTSVANEVGGVWGDTLGNPNTSGSGSSGQYWSAGVLGTADDSNAGAFFNNSNSGFYTVYADALGTSGAIGGTATSGIGVTGTSFLHSGVSGDSGSGDGVDGSSSSAYGVSGTSYGDGNSGSSFDGVSGLTNTPLPGNAGVFGDAYTTSGSYSTMGGFGFVAGVWGDTSDVNDGTSNQTVGIIGTADSFPAAFFVNNSESAATIEAVNNSIGGTGLFKVFTATTLKGTCGIGDGDLSCTGQVKSLVSAGGGTRTVETYATQSAESWMEDYGTGVMRMGVAVVKIDPAFAETISATPDYHVFITPNGDAEALYVINKTGSSFEVRESKGGTSSMTFDYKIVAKRRGYENQRLVDVTDRFNDEQSRSFLGRAHGTPIPAAQPRPRFARPAMKPIMNGNGAKGTVTPSRVPHDRPAPGRISGTFQSAPLDHP